MFLGEALCFVAFKILYYYYSRRGVSISDSRFFSRFVCLGFSLWRNRWAVSFAALLIPSQDGSVDNNALTKGSRIFNPLLLLVPALCDMFATSIMYIGLNMTYASSFQMLRGSVIVFTGMFSIGFLNRKLGAREWTGIAFVITGLAFVGASDILTMEDSDMSTNSVITGDLLIIFAQVCIYMLNWKYKLE